MSDFLKHKKAKLPKSPVYQEKKIAERNLKDHQHSLKAIQAEEKNQERLQNIEYNARVKQFAYRFHVNHRYVNLERED